MHSHAAPFHFALLKRQAHRSYAMVALLLRGSLADLLVLHVYTTAGHMTFATTVVVAV